MTTHWLDVANKEQIEEVIRIVRDVEWFYYKTEDAKIIGDLSHDRITLDQILICLHRQWPEICWAAIRQDCTAIRTVREPTEEMCLEAAKKFARPEMVLHYVSDEEMRRTLRIKHHWKDVRGDKRPDGTLVGDGE